MGCESHDEGLWVHDSNIPKLQVKKIENAWPKNPAGGLKPLQHSSGSRYSSKRHPYQPRMPAKQHGGSAASGLNAMKSLPQRSQCPPNQSLSQALLFSSFFSLRLSLNALTSCLLNFFPALSAFKLRPSWLRFFGFFQTAVRLRRRLFRNGRRRCGWRAFRVEHVLEVVSEGRHRLLSQQSAAVHEVDIRWILTIDEPSVLSAGGSSITTIAAR